MVERSLILATLKHLDGHKEKTAAALGVSLKTLYNRLKEYAEADGEAYFSEIKKSSGSRPADHK